MGCSESESSVLCHQTRYISEHSTLLASYTGWICLECCVYKESRITQHSSSTDR